MTVTWLDNGPRNVRQLVVNGFAVSAGKGDPLISAGGRTAHAQIGITPGNQLPGDGVKNFVKNRVANRLGAVEEKVVEPYVALGVTILRV